MKPFYSIVKFSPNVATEDSVAVGLLCFDGKKFRTFFSDKKRKLAQSLLDGEDVNIKFLLKQIEQKCKAINVETEKWKLLYSSADFVRSEYFDYLSKYANGLLRFSSPNLLATEITNEAFAKLVYAFFQEDTAKPIVESSTSDNYKEVVYQKLVSKVQEQVHTNYQFAPKHFPSIYFNFEIDCIGLNGSLIGAKSVSFEKSLPVIDKDISHYFTLISTLSSKYNKDLKENHFYLISEEPGSISSKEHQLWESVVKNDLIQVIQPEESSVVTNLIFDKKATKFLNERAAI